MEGRRFNLKWLVMFLCLAVFLSVLLHYHFKSYINDYINNNFQTKVKPGKIRIQARVDTDDKPVKPTFKGPTTTPKPTPTERARVKIVPKTTNVDTTPTKIHPDIEIMVKAPPVTNPAWAKMRTSKGTIDIMVYPRTVDTIVSASLLASGTWEPGELAGMEKLFQCDPDLGLVDIGANIGLYVLLGAKYGRQVIGVEPSMDNMGRLVESVYRNHYQQYITLVHNAISDTYTTMELTANPWNRGNTVIKDPKNANFHVQGEFEVANRLPVGSVKTVQMDDLVPLVKFKRGVLKIDIEGAEPLAFKHSRKFLTELDVPYVFMEWLWVKKDRNAAKELYDFFTQMGFKAFQDANLSVLLGDNYLTWPTDVFWVKPGKTGPCKVAQAAIPVASETILALLVAVAALLIDSR